MTSATLSPRLHALFSDYAEGHRHPINRLTHKVAIPVIVFHILAMLDWVPLLRAGPADITLAPVVLGAILGWYLWIAPFRLAAILIVLMVGLLPLAHASPRPLVWGMAVVGWGVQLAGHAVWEKNRPAFVRNLVHALVGPLFFVAILTGDWPVATERRP